MGVYTQNWLNPTTRKDLGKPLSPAIIKAVMKQLNSRNLENMGSVAGQMIQKNREAAIAEVQRWLFASFLEEQIIYFNGPSGEATVLKAPNGAYAMVMED